MEKKARVQRLSRQDDVRRSWAEAFQHLESVDIDDVEIEAELAEDEVEPIEEDQDQSHLSEVKARQTQ
jgi:Ran GTPase-activating protein (RanGAP) involved in mRNA processing and transport